MVTERNSILNQTVINEKVQKRYLHKLFIISLVCLIVGAIGVAAYIAVGVSLDMIYGEMPKWCEALLIFAVPFAFGLIFMLTINSLVRQAKRDSGVINEYEFFSDCILAHEIRGGEICATVRMDYSQIVKTKQLDEYIFFSYQQKAQFFPVDATALSDAEKNTILKLIGAEVQEGAEILTLSSASAAASEPTLAAAETSQENS